MARQVNVEREVHLTGRGLTLVLYGHGLDDFSKGELVRCGNRLFLVRGVERFLKLQQSTSDPIGLVVSEIKEQELRDV